MSRSFSALNTFMGCERRFWYERVDPARVRLPDNHYQALGTLYHQLLAELVLGGEFDFMGHVMRVAQEDGWPVPTPLLALKEEIAANLERVRREILPWLRKPVVEVMIREKYVGRLDLVVEETPVVEDGRIVGLVPGRCVLDFKIKFSSRRRSDRDVWNSPQLAQYCLMSGARAAGFIEVPRDVSAPLHVTLADFTEEELARWERYLDAQYAAVEKRGKDPAAYRLAAAGDPLCSSTWCPWFQGCPGGEGRSNGGR